MKVNPWKYQIALYYLSVGAIEVDSAGRIWRLKDRVGGIHRCRHLKPHRCEYEASDGYLTVSLSLNGENYSIYAHRLVWIALRDLIPEGFEINHKNGLRHDNRLENLELLTPSENVLHAIHILGKTLPDNAGELNGMAKLTEKDVREIRMKYHNNSITYEALGSMYGVSYTTIGDIINKRCWTHVV